MNAFFGSEDGRERSFEELDKMLVNIRSVGYILKTGTYYVQTYVGDAFVVCPHPLMPDCRNSPEI